MLIRAKNRETDGTARVADVDGAGIKREAAQVQMGE